ncbi:hypothetical protein [Bradyrhizobium sp. SZCCHNRI1073]|uniref:hypothetical protein n=1 Tax=Bradyrhizobium sp. SZCCHNRI1073 TaxID=3057280 RepID=UPI0029168552|nr:hypothetical protein [Bradyrhizobium sp. SZCCHNRI1073]
MAGLLDAIFAPSGGGLLDFLRNNAINQQMPSGLPSDQAQYGAPQIAQPAAMAANAQMMPVAQPAPATPVPQGQPVQQQGGFLQSLNENFQNMGNGGSLIGALTGQSPTNQTAQFLVSKGIDPSLAKSIVSDPATLRSILPQVLGFNEQKAPTALGDGYVWNPATKKIERAYTPEAKAPTSLGEGYVWNPATKKVERAFTPQSKEDKIGEEIKAREDALKARGVDPKDPKQQQYVLTGKYPREDAQPLSAADKKAIMSAEDDNALLVGTLDTLNRAKELNTKTFTGWTAGARGWAGTALPGASAVLDPEAAKATREFGQLMSGEAIKSMAETLKGATTDREMARFLEMLADPSTPPDIRERTINRMIQLAERQRKINDSRINDLRGGTYYKPGQGTSSPAAAAPTNLKEKYGLD